MGGDRTDGRLRARRGAGGKARRRYTGTPAPADAPPRRAAGALGGPAAPGAGLGFLHEHEVELGVHPGLRTMDGLRLKTTVRLRREAHIGRSRLAVPSGSLVRTTGCLSRFPAVPATHRAGGRSGRAGGGGGGRRAGGGAAPAGGPPPPPPPPPPTPPRPPPPSSPPPPG